MSFAATQNVRARELAYCGLFGAAAMLLPVVFHLLKLGSMFMPMYLPLIALAFFVGPLPAALTSFMTPLLSGVLTGMPPFFPPTAVMMAIELSIMSAIISFVAKRRPGVNVWLLLVPVLIFGRILYVAMVYFFNLFIDLPASLMAGVSLLSGWPGILLILVVVPFVVESGKTISRS